MQDPTRRCPQCAGDVRLNDLACRACGHVIRTQPLIGEILIDERLVTRDQLEQALKLQQRKLGEILVDLGACKPEDLDRAVHIQSRGRTRADLFAADLKRARIAIGALLLVVAVLGIGLWRSSAQGELVARMKREQLSLPEVLQIMEDPSSPHKLDALRSLSRQLKDPAAIGVIDRALRTEIWSVQLYAAMLARDAMSRDTVPALINLLTDPGVGAVAHESLLAITGQKLDRAKEPWLAWARTQRLAVEPGTPR